MRGSPHVPRGSGEVLPVVLRGEAPCGAGMVVAAPGLHPLCEGFGFGFFFPLKRAICSSFGQLFHQSFLEVGERWRYL